MQNVKTGFIFIHVFITESKRVVHKKLNHSKNEILINKIMN